MSSKCSIQRPLIEVKGIMIESQNKSCLLFISNADMTFTTDCYHYEGGYELSDLSFEANNSNDVIQTGGRGGRRKDKHDRRNVMYHNLFERN